MSERKPLRVALGEYDTGWHDPAASLRRAGEVIARAAAAGAELVVLPETATTGFTMETARYAEPLEGPSVAALGRLAKAHGVHLVAGVAVSGEGGVHNSALHFTPDGALQGSYRKQRLFAYAGEDRSYAEGAGPVVMRIGELLVAPFICFDLRFPELFRAVAPRVDAIVLIANWPAARRSHWDVLVRARAIENQCYVVAVNRVGEGGGLAYDGGSVVHDPWGEPVGGPDRPVVLDPAEVTRVRTGYPFTRDERL